MRAIRFHQWGSAPTVDEIAVPHRAPGETLVRVDAAAISHLDLSVSSGTFGMKPSLPYVGGVEASATVLESDGLTPGTRVLLRGKGLGLLRDGTWREQASVPSGALTPVDPRLPHDVAATFFVPCTTAYVALHDTARLQAGERVAVIGAAGAVGSMLLQQALLAGAEVTAVVSWAAQLSALPRGIEAVALDSSGAGASLARERKFDLLVDTIGGQGLADRTGWVRPGGRAVAIGYVAGEDVTVNLPSWLLADVALLPVNMITREKRAREVAPELIARIVAGELSVPVEQVDPQSAPDALARLADGKIRGRAVFTF